MRGEGGEGEGQCLSQDTIDYHKELCCQLVSGRAQSGNNKAPRQKMTDYVLQDTGDQYNNLNTS